MLEGMWIFCEKETVWCLMQCLCDTYNEDFSAPKRRKLGNNQPVTICGIYRP